MLQHQSLCICWLWVATPVTISVRNIEPVCQQLWVGECQRQWGSEYQQEDIGHSKFEDEGIFSRILLIQ